MDTRVLHTRFWRDEYALTLKPKEKLLFLYLLTNEYVNICGIYELPEALVSAYTGMSESEIKDAKEKFQKDGKFAFHHAWVRIMNVEKYQKYKGKTNDIAKSKELALVPKELIEYTYGIDTVSIPLVISNKKLVIRNKKVIEGESEGKQFLDKWNQVFSSKYSSLSSVTGNLIHWLDSYSLEQIFEAVEKVKNHAFWKDKMTPTMFLRKKNPRGEPVDYIGDMLNKQEGIKPIKMEK